MVAFAMFILFFVCERVFKEALKTPAKERTVRAAPPATSPFPDFAGFIITLPLEYLAETS